jgi:hypothetical protein
MENIFKENVSIDRVKYINNGDDNKEWKQKYRNKLRGKDVKVNTLLTPPVIIKDIAFTSLESAIDNLTVSSIMEAARKIDNNFSTEKLNVNFIIDLIGPKSIRADRVRNILAYSTRILNKRNGPYFFTKNSTLLLTALAMLVYDFNVARYTRVNERLKKLESDPTVLFLSTGFALHEALATGNLLLANRVIAITNKGTLRFLLFDLCHTFIKELRIKKHIRKRDFRIFADTLDSLDPNWGEKINIRTDSTNVSNRQLYLTMTKSVLDVNNGQVPDLTQRQIINLLNAK